MKKGICIGSLPGGSTEAQFKLAKEAGFDGVEINTLGNDDDYMTAELPVDGDNPEGRVHSISDDMSKIIAGTV